MARILWQSPLYDAASTGGGSSGGVTEEQAAVMVQSNDGSMVAEDTEIVLISSSPDVCFVRRVENATQTCLSNMAANEENSAVNTTESDFEPGANLTLSDLPTFLQSLCVNRTITELVPADDNTTTTTPQAPSTGGRKKRSIFRRYCCIWRTYYVLRCRYFSCCKGWLFGRRCSTCRSCYWITVLRFSCGNYCPYWGKK
ncbi:hypothetical protein ACOMHN_039542 [Nucella lapillus]